MYRRYCNDCFPSFYLPNRQNPNVNTDMQNASPKAPGSAAQNQIPAPMPMSPSDFEQAPGSPTNLDTQYTQGYLKTKIGKRVRISFLLGTNTFQDRTGTLLEVGISYVVIQDIDTNTQTLCDIYSIKFVTFYS
ncbi:hypothetical protein [Clostridium guangxiense]|uniref:hypothetical protein n=1 Tax=Clostridium guangxiense TaxID=1662055 RepID=UPI001E4DB6AA|nr:hypothetical protein [Clostridium guangxiense]MCD2346227.1 hypothetical protein [Clostridium guangxiense]